ncbi:MAG: guanylate kinase [Candidatus Omnitrophota bacterium]
MKTLKPEKTKIFIISGPGGVGKTTLVQQLFQIKGVQDSAIKAVTITTRQKRSEEEEGKDYFFVDKEEFLRLENNSFFLESQKFLNDYYGTPKILRGLAKKKEKNLVLCIDVQGGMCLKKKYKDDTIVTIFITASSEKELTRRMKKRDESGEMIEKRIELAKKELQLSKKYDFLVVNKNIKNTLEELKAILLENRSSSKKKVKQSR